MSLLRRFLRRGAIDPDTTAAADASIDDVAVHVRAGRYTEALRTIDSALTRQPGDANWLFARGSLLFEWGRLWEARADLLQAWQKDSQRPGLDLQLGWIDLRAGRIRHAERWMRNAVDRNPDNWQSHYGLAGVLRAAGNCEAAADAYSRALERSPGDLDCLVGLVGCFIAQRRFSDAEALARRAVSEHAEAVAAWAGLGAVLIWQDRFDEANQAFDRIRRLESSDGSPVALPLDAGIPLRDGGRVDEAIDFYRHALRGNPDLNAHAHYAFSLLKAGHLREGWEQNEFRWMIEPLRTIRLRAPIPIWSGQDVKGKRLLVTAEQGIGDVIQFIRYVRQVKALGAAVHVLLRKPMREIVDGMAGVDRVHQLGDTLPDGDFVVPVMSLPRVFGTTLESIPASVPYIPLKPDRVERWRRALAADGTLRVGLAWSGDPIGLRNPYKSIPLQLLAPLAMVPGVRFYSLQKGDAARDVAAVAADFDVIDLSPEIRDFADTAAIIDSLDLVISICTSVAHLAGALGKPAWTLLSQPADWRWLERRDDTPWYPTMRLFRQSRQGDWTTVVDDVKRALEDFMQSRHESLARPTQADLSVAQSAPVAPPPATSALCRTVDTRFGVFQIRPEDARGARSLAWYGDYLWRQLDYLRARIKPGAIVVDIASAMGCDAPLLASAVGEAGHLFAFESRAALLPLLANNLAAHGIANVTVLAMPLKGCIENLGDHADGAEIAPVSLDDLGLPAFQWLKINEDADALAILEGAANCVWKFRPGLFISASAEHIDAIGEAVRDFGYHSARIDSPLFDAGNFNRRTEDIFGGQLAYAVLAIPEEHGVELPAFGAQIVASAPH